MPQPWCTRFTQASVSLQGRLDSKYLVLSSQSSTRAGDSIWGLVNARRRRPFPRQVWAIRIFAASRYARPPPRYLASIGAAIAGLAMFKSGCDVLPHCRTVSITCGFNFNFNFNFINFNFIFHVSNSIRSKEQPRLQRMLLPWWPPWRASASSSAYR